MSSAEFNRCASLVDSDSYDHYVREYQNLKNANADPFNEIMQKQNMLQERYAAQHGRTKPPKELKTKGDLIDFILDQKLAIDDEFRELIESIHGMSRPASERSAGWKKWKSQYDTIRSEGINQGLSDDDQLERSCECIDIMHFIINILLALNIDSEELYILYNLKNKENFNRQDNNY